MRSFRRLKVRKSPNLFTSIPQKRYFLDGIVEHITNYPLNTTIGIASIAGLGYGLREYVSRKIMYQPYDRFASNWQSLLANVEYKEIEFKNIKDIDIHLHGLYIPGHNKQFSEYPLLFFHGNGGNVSHRIENLLLLHHDIGCDVFIFDYRNYGKSCNKTRPSQNGLIDDAISAMNELKKLKKDKDIKPIIFGRSLGGAVAFHSIESLIKEYNVNIAVVIVENSFSSIIDVDKSYKVLSPLIADKWDNWKCIDRMKEQNMTHIPFLFISAVNDTI